MIYIVDILGNDATFKDVCLDPHYMDRLLNRHFYYRWFGKVSHFRIGLVRLTLYRWVIEQMIYIVDILGDDATFKDVCLDPHYMDRLLNRHFYYRWFEKVSHFRIGLVRLTLYRWVIG